MEGHILLAVDGSKINVPDTPETRKRYNICTNQYDKEGVIQALASFLCDVLNEININSSIDDLKTEKNIIFKEHIKYYRKKAVIIYDKHYADYSVLASHAKIDSDFVIRCPTSNTFRKIEEFIKSVV